MIDKLLKQLFDNTIFELYSTIVTSVRKCVQYS